MLLQIIAATALGGLASVALAAALSLNVLSAWAPRLVSYAVGVLLGAAFLDLLPEAINQVGPEEALATGLAGLLAFFVLEKLALWRHAHAGHGHAGIPPHPSGAMILVGDGIHNFVDGVLIAAAFLADPALGWSVALAVFAHEVPQEIGDFAILMEAGYGRQRALALNALSGAAAVAGGVAGWAALSWLEHALPYALAVSAASFLYIAVADLIPHLHHRRDVRDTLAQCLLIGLGVLTLVLVHSH